MSTSELKSNLVETTQSFETFAASVMNSMLYTAPSVMDYALWRFVMCNDKRTEKVSTFMKNLMTSRNSSEFHDYVMAHYDGIFDDVSLDKAFRSVCRKLSQGSVSLDFISAMCKPKRISEIDDVQEGNKEKKSIDCGMWGSC